jgi:hypothetical protein
MICETQQLIWTIIALFTTGGIASGFLLGYGLGLLRA